MNKEITRESLKRYIKSTLGSPILNVELTDEMLDDCIDDAINDMAPWIVLKRYLTVPTEEVIDLSSYNVSHIIAVYKTRETGTSPIDNGRVVDVFSFRGTPYYYGHDHAGLCPICNNNSNYGLNAITNVVAEIQMQDQVMGYIKDNISFQWIPPNLYLDIGYPSSPGVTIEYCPILSDVDVLNDELKNNYSDNARLYLTYLKKLSVARARLRLSDIRGKFTVNNSPIELDGQNQYDRATTDIDTILQELKDTLLTDYAID